ncbi:MAG TPA: hypothetical protein PKB10_14175, partial [Tepidisphaeraceae bacterium]|nr:hypothetical protein [Tepidisphaeraceae bacterium]
TLSQPAGVQLPVFQRGSALTFASWVNIDSVLINGTDPGPEAFLFSMVTDGPNQPNFQSRVNGGSGVFQIGQ